ncbi:MAG TPA: CheR family methyltransferase [Solirubrobacter sp.]|nr:CheR family methyltransferase [Solirubrobacter sp.]
MIEAARALIADRLGLDFPARRGDDLQRALTVVAGAGREAGLVAALQDPHDRRWPTLIHALTVRESYFFRDAPLFERILHELVERRRAEGDLRLTVWSAGCATGEEPYSLAMLLDRLLGDVAAWQVAILATDVDVAALETAARGAYTEWALRATPAWARARYFDERLTLARRIRERVTFVPLNLAADPYLGAFDLIVCRNVLMYFTERARRATVERLAAAVSPGGRLALSPLDVTIEPAGFETIDDGRVLRRRAEELVA